MEYRIPEDNHWWFASRTHALNTLMSQFLPQTPGLRLLDVGCGAAGYLLGQAQVSFIKK